MTNPDARGWEPPYRDCHEDCIRVTKASMREACEHLDDVVRQWQQTDKHNTAEDPAIEVARQVDDWREKWGIRV